MFCPDTQKKRKVGGHSKGDVIAEIALSLVLMHIIYVGEDTEQCLKNRSSG